MDENQVIIQIVDQESLVKDFYCAYHAEREEVVAIIAFREDGFSIFWSDTSLPTRIQLNVICEARVMFAERLA